MSTIQQRGSISEQAALAVLQAAAETAANTAQRFAIAVVDESGQLKAFLRQDGAKLNAVQIAQDKAYTAASSTMSTEAWSEKLVDDSVLGAAAPTTIERLAPMGGGLPVVVDGQTVGAIGVSGAHWTDDVKIAEAGLKALN